MFSAQSSRSRRSREHGNSGGISSLWRRFGGGLRCRRCLTIAFIAAPYLLLASVLDDHLLGGLLRNVSGSLFNMQAPDDTFFGAATAGGVGGERMCPPEEAVSWGFQPFMLITSQKSGSTWLIRRLNTHPNMATEKGEVVRTALKQGAFGEASEDDLSSVTWEAYRDELQRAFYKTAGCKAATGTAVGDTAGGAPPPQTSPCLLASEQGLDAVGFKVMYNQIPGHLLGRLADWLSCQGVVVLHSTRNAFESFMSYQSQAIDATAHGVGGFRDPAEERIRTNDTSVPATLGSNSKAIHVSEYMALTYVSLVESEAEAVRRLFLQHPRGVAYMELHYHLLTGSSADRYFRSLQAFLGVSMQAMEDTITKLHFGSCAARVSNWKAVAKALKGTQALELCSMVGAGDGSGGKGREAAARKARRRRGLWARREGREGGGGRGEEVGRVPLEEGGEGGRQLEEGGEGKEGRGERGVESGSQ